MIQSISSNLETNNISYLVEQITEKAEFYKNFDFQQW